MAEELGIRLMNRLVFVVLLTGMVLIACGCERSSRAQTVRPSTRPSTSPATRSSGESLLLLEEEEPAAGNAKLLADNSRCHVCHANFEREDLSLKHAQAGVGCAKCHGASDAHIDDESWSRGGNGTAPEIMYPGDKINAACMACHEPKFDKTKHKDFAAGMTREKTCTECHGKHKMAIRRCKWK